MLTKVRRRLAEEEGFTLIELLVVILIIGILAAVAIPTFLSQKNKATDSNAQSNLKNAQTVVESYANGNGGQYPTDTTGDAINNVPGLTNDSDVSALGGTATNSGVVSYTSSGGSSDTYTLTALGSNNSIPHYWAIVVNNGQTTYGEGTTPALAISNASGNTAGFPSITTS